jgi:hypothetical protein
VEKKLYSTVKISIKTKIAFLLNYKISKKKENNRSIKLGLGGNKIRTVAYFLPEKEQFTRLAIHYLNNLNKHNLEIKLICRSSVSELFNVSVGNSDIFISDEQLNRFGLPHPSTTDKMNQVVTDAVVDLNPEFDPVHGILMQKINSPLKIGFESHWSQKLFTITLTANNNGYMKNQYHQINNLLGIQ